MAEQGIDAAAAGRAERAFRGLLQSAVQPPRQLGQAPLLSTLAGDPTAIAFTATPQETIACAPPGDDVEVTLLINDIESGGELVCAAGGREARLLAWPAGRGRFAFSRDGAEWVARWRAADSTGGRDGVIETVIAPLVTFEIVNGARTQLAWVERAGRTAPFRSVEEAPQQEATPEQEPVITQ
jgi:hypothetical protein